MLARRFLALCIMVLALFLILRLSADWARRYKAWFLVTEHPVRAQATVEALETSGSSDAGAPRFTVRYRYPLPLGASGTGSAQLSAARFARLHQGDRLAVVYSQPHPDQSILLEEIDSPPATPWILRLAFALVAISPLLWLWRSYRRARLLEEAPAFNPLGVALAKSPQQILDDTERRNRILLRAMLILMLLAGFVSWPIALKLSWAEPLASVLTPALLAGVVLLLWWGRRCTVCGQGACRWYGRCSHCGSRWNWNPRP